MLGKHGLSEKRIRQLTEVEMDGYLAALDVIHGKASVGAPGQTRRTVKSMRRKRPNGKKA